MDIHEMRKLLGDTQSEFATRYNIPFRTIQNWETGARKPPTYVSTILEYLVKKDLINRRTVVLPKYDSKKLNLPKRSDYIGAKSWLKAVQECFDEPVVFALDEALICQGNFGGRSDEYLVWVYGNETVSRFNGVVILGTQISSYYVENRNGLNYTNFNRTIFDALANESILDMQGITEALSRYYSLNGNNFDGIFVTPEYQDKLEKLLSSALDYYES